MCRDIAFTFKCLNHVKFEHKNISLQINDFDIHSFIDEWFTLPQKDFSLLLVFTFSFKT